MGKVQSGFTKCFPGMISRSADDIVISEQNAETAEIPAGSAIFMTADGKGVTMVKSGSTFARFVGISVRSASATPETYGANTRPYQPKDVVDIIVRGCVVVALDGEMVENGGPVYVKKSNGQFTTEEVSGDTILLSNCSWRRESNLADNCAEIVIRERNLT